MTHLFRKFAELVAVVVGTPWAFITALTLIVAWAASGPFFGFSEQWQLVVNSLTTIVTFLMVFIIQNTQNRDFKALQLKLDELLRASENSHPGMVNLHNLSDDELQQLEQAFERFGGRHDIKEIVRSLEKPRKTNPAKSPAG